MQSQTRPRSPFARPRPARPRPEAASAPPDSRAALMSTESSEIDPAAAVCYEQRDLFAVAELARFYLFNGSAQVARVLFEGLTAIAPGEPCFALGLALTYDRLNLKKEAAAEYQRAEKLDPSDGRPDINRAELLLEEGDKAQARILLARGANKAQRKNDRELERKARALLARLDGKNGR